MYSREDLTYVAGLLPEVVLRMLRDVSLVVFFVSLFTATNPNPVARDRLKLALSIVRAAGRERRVLRTP